MNPPPACAGPSLPPASPNLTGARLHVAGLRSLFAVALVLAACGGDALPIEPGVPASLAAARAARLSDVRYQLELWVPDSLAAPVRGRARIDVSRRGGGALVLDFAATERQVAKVEANGRPVPVDLRAEHLVVPENALVEGENRIDVEFRAGDGSLNRSEEFLYTLFVPDRARWAFPCFDQPDMKARFALTLHVPQGWAAVSNGAAEAVVEEEPLPGRPALTTYRFAETAPLPTYLFSFAAGRFEVEEATRDGRRLRLFHRETDAEKVARNREGIFDLHATALVWLEEYTGIPYPFGKFDFVAVPSFQYSGMEHPGAILYRASSLFLDPSATQGQRLARASVIAHETAHMWFGDLVTMRWFDDVWMKEVFANFMAAKIVNPSFPELDHDLRFLLAHHPAAYAVDRTGGANPIRQPLDNLNEAGTLYGAIIYQKAPIVMRQLERWVGEETFREGLREYLAAHRFGNASWPDLIAILDRRTEDDLEAWSRVWVEEPGRPTVWLAASGSGPAAASSGSGPEAGDGDGAGPAVGAWELRQEDPRGRGLVWEQVLEVTAGGPGGVRGREVRLAAPVARVELPAGTGLDAYRLPDGSGVGYARFRLAEADGAYLLAHLPEVPAAVPRAAAWLALWDEMLEGAIDPDALVDLALRTVELEGEEQIVERILDDLRTAWWRFLSPERRAHRAPALEALLWRRMGEAETMSLKASFFRAYVELALTEDAVGRLTAVWRQERAVPGLPLSEGDFTRLAGELAVREAPAGEEILAAQQERIENPDRSARFAFVRPALSADRATRDAFFASLADPASREHEPWVLEAVRYLHHPVRAETALRYLRPSLDLLEEIQRTGDIFFPKRWLDATLGGHASPEAAAIVRGFLEERPDLPPRLRAKVLQSADLLFRAAR